MPALEVVAAFFAERKSLAMPPLSEIATNPDVVTLMLTDEKVFGNSSKKRPGYTPLIDAAYHGHAANVVALLADGADVNEPRADGLGGTALQAASLRGHVKIVKKLLAARANVNQAQKNGCAALWAACVTGPHRRRPLRGRHRPPRTRRRPPRVL